MTRVTTLTADELESLLFLVPRILADHRPQGSPSAMLYVFSNTLDNERSSFERAARDVHEGRTMCVGVCAGEIANGYPGFAHCAAALASFGVEGSDIRPIRVHGNVNTYSEAMALAEICTTLKGDLELVAPPFHIVRAFVTMVTAMRNAGVCHRVFARAGMPLSWTDEATHSQGSLRARRAGFLESELMRLERYRSREFGALADAEEALRYLEWRDRQ